MRLFLIMGIVVMIDLYAFQALITLIGDTPSPTRNVIKSIYWGISVFFTLLIICGILFDLFERIPKQFTVIIFATFFLLLIGKIFTSIFLTFDDIRRLITFVFSHLNPQYEYNPSRSKFLAKLSLVMGAVPIIIMGNGILRNAFRYKKHFINVNIDHLPDDLEGLKIIQISDIHSGTYLRDKPIHKAIEMINEENPDLIFFTGDLVNEVTDEVNDYIPIFKQIKAKKGVFSVLGNHDYGDYFTWKNAEEKNKNLAAMHKAHKDMGWTLLLNENKILDFGNARLNIIGVENISGNNRFHTYGNMKRATEGINFKDTTLLLSHDPTHWDLEITKDFPDVDVTFSGHTHGMQFGIEIPGIIKWSPAKYLYPKWAGLYREKKQYLYVNRGFGTLGYPGRVGILPEITVMTLTKA